MARRRLRVVCSSDEEEPPLPSPPLPRSPSSQGEQDDIIIDDIETDFQTVKHHSSNRTPDTDNSATNVGNTYVRFSSEPIHLDISDDEERDVNNNSKNRSGYSSTSGNNQSDSGSYFSVSDSPVDGVLERLGLRLKREWLNSCLISLQSSVLGFQGKHDPSKAKLCFGKFLCLDMNYYGAGVLTSNVHTLNLIDLKGPFVLQVDEIVNISCPLRGRYQNTGPGIKKCLKLSMTDGVQRVFGMEYRPIKDLEIMARAGLKIVLLNVNIRHGLLMLVPEVLEVLGGSADELAAARQRLVNEINKPPREKRCQIGLKFFSAFLSKIPLVLAVLRWMKPQEHCATRNVDRTGGQPLTAAGQAFNHMFISNQDRRVSKYWSKFDDSIKELHMPPGLGTMVLEMNKTSHVPVALEMTRGYSVSDASLLLG